MHPIERLRMVARSDHDEPSLIAQQAAASLVALAGEPGALLMACRRLLDRHPACGPLWWLSARLVASPNPGTEAMRAADELDDDPTPATVAAELPHEAVVTILGWPHQAGEALSRRLDLEPRIVDCRGEGSLLASRLERLGGRPLLVPAEGLAPAVAASDVVLLEAGAIGPGGFFALPGSWAAAAVAQDARRPVWVVAGTGRVLPPALWEAALARLPGTERPPQSGSPALGPWDRNDEVVPLHLVDQVLGPKGPQPPDAALARADSPSVPELTRRGVTPGSEPAG